MKANLHRRKTQIAAALCGISCAASVGAAMLEEVVVTAQKREQTLQDVPISLSVVGGNELENFGLRDFSDLSTQIPNFFVQDTPGNYAIYIRGMGSTAGNLAFEQTVGLFVDNVYAGKARQFQNPFLDLERIEVLRGPQGALVGKNTSAGAINVITRKPTQEPEISLGGGYEFEGETFNTTGILSGPLAESLQGRLAASYSQTDEGFTENLGLGDSEKQLEDTVLRGTLLWNATDALEAILKAEVARSRIDGNSYETLMPGDSLDYKRNTTGFPGLGGRDYNNTDSSNLTLTLNYALDEITLTSISALSEYDFDKFLDSDFSPVPILGSTFAEDFQQVSQEFRLLSPASDTLEYVVGFYAHSNEYQLDQSSGLQFGPFSGGSARSFDQDNEVYSLYGQATVYLADSLRLNLSGRQTEDRKEADQTRANAGTVLPTWLDTPLSGDRDESHFDPAVNLQWDLDIDTMLYLTWSEGSKAGGFVGAQATTTQDGFEVEPEEAETYELGFKVNLLDNRLVVNGAWFHTEYTNLQVSTWDADSSSFVTANAASATTEGFEGDFAWLPTERLVINGAIAYLDAKYDSFVGADCLWNNPGCDVATNDIGGTRLPRTSRWSGTLALEYEQPLPGDLRLDSRAEVIYNSEKALVENLSPYGIQDGFTKFNLRLALSPANDRWTVAVVGKNLTDETTFSHAFGTPLATAPDTYTYLVDPPRTVALQFDYRFM